jgi:hypothetical protein
LDTETFLQARGKTGERQERNKSESVSEKKKEKKKIM